MSGKILRAHGGGGTAMSELLEKHVFPRLANDRLGARADAAVWGEAVPEGARLAMTTDAYVVSPLFFPGADLGRLAVCGTVNDLAVCGARPVALSLALILEEGFPTGDLDRLMDSVAAAAREAGVEVVTGDTKVVERGAGNGCYAVMAGVGIVPPGRSLDVRSIAPGDAILLSAPVADHGVAVMAARNGIDLRGEVRSDAAPLASLVESLLEAAPGTRFLRDATRGGVSAVLSETAATAGRPVEIEETAVRVRPATAAALSLLGLDPLAVANEGVIVAVVPDAEAAAALRAMRGHERGREAARIGTVGEDAPARVVVRTAIGGRRILVPPYGEELPRIC